MSLFSGLRKRFDAIPLVLRITALASIGLGSGLPLVAVIPTGTVNIGGTVLSRQELWETRVALALFANGALMLVIGLGILRRAGWVRLMLVLLPFLQMLPLQLVHRFFSAPDPTPSFQTYLLSNGIWGLLAAGYLFGVRSVRDYFSSESQE